MSYLVVGASRGIGLEFCKQLLQKHPDGHVYALVRNLGAPALVDLKENPRLHLISCDITDQASVTSAAQELSQWTNALDSIIVCAGVSVGLASPLEFPVADLRANLDTNVVGTMSVVNAFVPFLLASSSQKRSLVLLTALLASLSMAKDVAAVTMPRLGLDYMPALGYSVSKTARNMLAVQYAMALNPKGIDVIAMSPGWVKTDMGGEQGMQEIDYSVSCMLDTIDKFDLASGDIFKGFHGGTYSW